MNNLSSTAKKVIIIAAGALVLLLAIFLVFRPNLDKKATLENEIKDINNQIMYLQGLESICAELRENSDELLAETEDILHRFPASMPQEKVYYEIHKMIKETGVSVSSVSVSEPTSIYTGTNYVVPEEGAETPEEGETEFTEPSINDMVGNAVDCTFPLSGTEKQIMNTIEWFDDHEEFTSLSNVSLSFDSTTGQLSGSMTAQFYSLEGMGRVSDSLSIPGIGLGNPNIFGTFNK